MLIGLKIVYSCNHIVSNMSNSVINEPFTKSNTDTDTLVTYGAINKIYSIYQNLVDDTSKFYYEGVDFIINADNVSIKWISLNLPANGSDFFVEFTNSIRITNQYEAENCPKCSGSGWYISLFDDSITTIKKITGINKLVQEFIKILLTYKVDQYGSTLLDITRRELSDQVKISSEISSIIFDCESQFKQIQLTDINSGELMDNSEKLKSATLIDVEFDDVEKGVYVSIILISEENDTSQLNLMI